VEERTLGDIAAGLTRYRAQIIPILGILVIALFLDGKQSPASSGSTAAASTAAAVNAPQFGSASVPPALAGPTSAVDTITARAATDLSAAGVGPGGTDLAAADVDSGPVVDTPGPPVVPAAISGDNDESLPTPVIAPVMEQLRSLQAQLEASTGPLPQDIAAYVSGAAGCSPGVDPLSLVVEQLGPVLNAAGPALSILAQVNSQLPPVPVPPPVPIPDLPAGLDPVLSAAFPATSAVCGEAATSVLLIAVLASFPLPITGQHANAIIGPIFGLCAAATPQSQAP
jgi:hypothetical protein